MYNSEDLQELIRVHQRIGQRVKDSESHRPHHQILT